MKIKSFLLFLSVLLIVVLNAQQPAFDSFTVNHLTCEYGQRPIGIDNELPRLSWNIKSNVRNWKQSAYQMIISSDSVKLSKNIGDISDAGKIMSNENIHVRYRGMKMKSFMNCWWKVRVWDAKGNVSAWSKASFWKMGILDKMDWVGKWIGSDLKLKGYQVRLRNISDFNMEPEIDIWKRADSIRKEVHIGNSAPAVYLRKEFNCHKQIKRATAYICGLGLHELYMNGKRVGNDYLNPAYTDYQKEVLYNTYDVTGYMQNGANTIGVILGNGWYNLIVPHVLRFYCADYIEPPKLRSQLLVEYTDGSTAIIATDGSWKYTTNGPIVYNDILSGEDYDARKEMPGWCNNGFNDGNWHSCFSVKAPKGKLVSQQLDPITKLNFCPAVNVEKIGNKYRFDLGQEICGWVKFKIKGKRGQKIRISYEGQSSHTLGRYQTDNYTLKGNEQEVFQPRFSYNGFRYIDVYGLDHLPSLSDVEGVLVATDKKKTGEFSCSNDKLNKIQKILLNTINNYITHIPNDPTREKSGWSQDIENGFDVNSYNFDVAKMYIKWQHDFNDIVYNNGYVPPVVPGRFAGPTINGPWWGGMIVYNVIKLNEYYHDIKIVKNSYAAMKKYVGYLTSISKDNIVEWGLGDWMEPYGNQGGRPTTTQVALTSTVAYYYFTKKMAEFSNLLQKKSDARYFKRLAVQIKESYLQHFFDSVTGKFDQGSQADQLMSLHFGLVPPDKKKLVIQRLKDAINQRDGHLSTGFVATPVLLTTLSDLGLAQAAYTMATKNDFPSWFDMVFNKGNSVMKENWEGGLVQMPSLAGPIGYWFYYSLAGIRQVPGQVGFKKILIKPDFIKELSWVSASYQSIQGKIVSKWRRKGGQIALQVAIPANTTAVVYLPAHADNIWENEKKITRQNEIQILNTTNKETSVRIGSGKYLFRIKKGLR